LGSQAGIVEQNETLRVQQTRNAKVEAGVLSPVSRQRTKALGGDKVEFEVTKGPKGLQAANVRKI